MSPEKSPAGGENEMATERGFSIDLRDNGEQFPFVKQVVLMNFEYLGVNQLLSDKLAAKKF